MLNKVSSIGQQNEEDHMGKLLALFFILITASSVSRTMAEDANAAYEQVCKHLVYDSEKMKCADMIRQFSYFDAGALNLCTKFVYDSEKVDCLSYIGGKTYLAFEITTCKDLVYDSEKLTCLKKFGKPVGAATNCVSKDEAIARLSLIYNDLKTAQYYMAEARVRDLLNKFYTCP